MSCKNKATIRVIKKYQNRRLYDTGTSTYMVLDDVKRMIMDGDEIHVIDIKTNKDVTRNVLLQIVLDEEVNGVPNFSNDFLYENIRFYGKVFQSVLGPFLDHSVELFNRMQKILYEKLRESHKHEGDSSVLGLKSWQDFILGKDQVMNKLIRDYLKQFSSSDSGIEEQIEQYTQNFLEYIKSKI